MAARKNGYIALRRIQQESDILPSAHDVLAIRPVEVHVLDRLWE